MQRKPMIGTNSNPHNLKQLPVNEEFWKEKNLTEISELLWDALIMKNGHTALPEHDNLQGLLEVIAKQLPRLAGSDVLRNLRKLKENPDCVRTEEDAVLSGEQYLCVAAAIQFYMGNYAEAGRLAGVLGDAYFLYRHNETARLSSHFNQIAALAYQECENGEMACHYYNQYLVDNRQAALFPDEVSAAMKYLLQNHRLVCTDNLLTLLARKAKECGDDYVLAGTLRRQADSAENGAIYTDLDRVKAKANLVTGLDVVLQSLQSMSVAASQAAMFSPRVDTARSDTSHQQSLVFGP